MDELHIVLEAYRIHRRETDGGWPIRNVAFYTAAEKWLKEQGCDIDIFKFGQEGCPVWENQSRQVEFYLKYVK